MALTVLLPDRELLSAQLGGVALAPSGLVAKLDDHIRGSAHVFGQRDAGASQRQIASTRQTRPWTHAAGTGTERLFEAAQGPRRQLSGEAVSRLLPPWKAQARAAAQRPPGSVPGLIDKGAQFVFHVAHLRGTTV